MSALSQRQWTGRHALALLMGFFGVVFAANAVFVYVALESWTGLSTDDAYRKGLTYNQTIARADAQHALGWRVAVTLEAAAPGRQRLALTLYDRDGRPIDGRAVTATLRGPPETDSDLTTQLAWVYAGRYAAEFASAYRGRRDVHIEVDRGAAEPYLIETELWLK